MSLVRAIYNIYLEKYTAKFVYLDACLLSRIFLSMHVLKHGYTIEYFTDRSKISSFLDDFFLIITCIAYSAIQT